MSDYKPNSHRFKEEQKESTVEKKKVEKIVRGTAKVKKKSGLTKFAEVFIAEDASNVTSFIVSDVIVPSVLNLVEDIVVKGIHMFLRGDRGRRGGSGSSRLPHVSYNRYSDRYSDRRDSRYDDDRRSRNGYSYDDIILDNRGEAEEVLDQMDNLIKEYGEVTVGDLYDLVGISGNYTDNKYGWTNIRNAEPVRVRDGYLLKLPKAQPL